MRRGAVAMVIVMLVTMAGLFVLAGWQSRLLLAIQRSQSVSDALAATYAAESEIYDWVARFLGGYPQLFASPLTAASTVIKQSVLPDSTQMTVTGQLVNGEETLLVTANRQFAQTSIELARGMTTTESTAFDEVEIAISLDCSGSMNSRADPACVGGGCTTRMTEAKNALVSFIDRVETEQQAGVGQILVGLNVFKRQSQWATYSGVTLTPTADMPFLRQAVGGVFTNLATNSPACRAIRNPGGAGGGETNLGDGAVDLARYLAGNVVARKKQIMILITDGLPNWSLADSACGTATMGCGDGGPCTGEAIRYLTCGVADTNTAWETGRFGLRMPGTDVYAVTVANPGTPSAQIAFNATMAVFINPNYIRGYYANQNATQLSGFLDDIFTQIIQGSQQVRLRRVVPTPFP